MGRINWHCVSLCIGVSNMNNLEIVQEAWIGARNSEFADASRFMYLDNGNMPVIVRFPYETRVGNNPNYGVAYGNGPFRNYPSFVDAMERAAWLLRCKS
jgi:hypothetical protein